MTKIFVILIMSAIGLSSCVQKEPYEIKSPCVSGDSDNPWAINPCIKKPLFHDIG
ncbi:MAG: DUF2706 domain-containing protein [Pseudomonadota bacterium]